LTVRATDFREYRPAYLADLTEFIEEHRTHGTYETSPLNTEMPKAPGYLMSRATWSS